MDTSPVSSDTTTARNVPLPMFIIIRGIPGSGKSYLATALAQTLGSSRVVVLDPDSIDHASPAYHELSRTLAERQIEEKFHPHRFVRANAEQAVLAHKILIWNQPFTDLGGFTRTVQHMRTFAAEHQLQLPLLVVEVELDPTIAHQRIAERKSQGGHGPSENTFRRRIAAYGSFANEGYQTVSVRGDADVTASVQTILQAITSL